jgi:predicted RNA binding protein YcfA (HicA-like mRNA interferase family)
VVAWRNDNMLALPHITGSECISLLEQLGYRAQKRAGGLASLRRGINVVIVPENATLSPALVAAILRSADVDPLDFLDALEEHGPTPSMPPSKVA